MILKVSLSIRKSIESGPGAFLSLNLLRVVVSSASVNGLSGGASKCMSLLLDQGYDDVPNNSFVRCSKLFCLKVTPGGRSSNRISSEAMNLPLKNFWVLPKANESSVQNFSHASHLAV